MAKAGAFHRKHGINIRLLEDETIARRVNGYNNAVVFTAQAIPLGGTFQVKLLDMGGGWSGSIRFGFTCACPDDIPVPNGALKLYRSSDYWILSASTVHHSGEERKVDFNLESLRVGQTVGCLVNKTGELHYYVDGNYQGVGWAGMPRDRPLWGFADIYGLARKIKSEFLYVPEQSNSLQQQLPQPDQGEQVIRDLLTQLDQNQQTIQDLRRQLDQNQLITQDLQRRNQQAIADLQQRAADTERDLRHQLTDEKRHYEEQLERLCGGQSSSTEVEFWTIPHDEVKMDREIGVGGWGSVFKGTFHGRAVAVKRLHPTIVSRENISRLHREVRLMAHVRHPNILLFIGAVFKEVDQLCPPLIILELLDVDLRKAYQSDMVAQHNLLPIFRDVACALDYLHSLRQPIIHRDVSAPNILLEAMANNQWKAKVSDFGSANIARLAQTAAEGAIIYSAPECLPEEIRGPVAVSFPQTPKIDVYSYGVLLCEVITCTLPRKLGQVKSELRRKWPVMHDLADACTNYDPNNRPTIAHVLNKLNKMTP